MAAEGSIVQDDIQKRTVNFYIAVVMNKPQFSKAVHEVIHPPPSCAYHRGQRFLAYLGNQGLGLVLLAVLSQQQQ